MNNNLNNFVSNSETFCAFTFSGQYNMDSDIFLKLFSHFINTRENLLDAYSKILYKVWDNGAQAIVIDQDEYNEITEYINHKLLKTLFDKETLQTVQLKIDEQLKRYLNILGYDTKRIIASVYTSKYHIRQSVFKLHGKACLCCGAVNKLSLDHVKPVIHGGYNSIDNLQPLCTSCNSKKGSKMIDYRKAVKR